MVPVLALYFQKKKKKPDFFLFCWPVSSSWSFAVPGPVVFYPLGGCSLILHAPPAKARISLRIRTI